MLARLLHTEKLEYGDLVTPLNDKDRSIYNWYLFKHSYSRELVVALLQEFCIPAGSRVLDPFCGAGTTLLACRESALHSAGYDILPFSVFVTNTKANSYLCDPSLLRKQLKKLKLAPLPDKIQSLPDMKLFQRAFSPKILRTLFGIKKALVEISPQIHQDFFMLGLLSIVEQFSIAKKSGGFLRLVDRKIDASGVILAFKQKVRKMIEDLENANYAISGKTCLECEAKLGDARKLPIEKEFDAVITSPPYPNRHDYTRIYSLELAMHFVQSNQELKEIRYKTLRSHVEARTRFEPENYIELEEITKLLTEISNGELNNKRIVPMLRGYFEDMFLALSESSRCLKKGGFIAFVVSNTRFAGITVPVDIFLSQIGEQVGLTPKHIWVARYKGNSPQQMAKYGRVPSRESIIIWEKR